ncbi:MAG: hypothetical protein V4443_08515 [Pseudomonadota bacterium]
MKLNYVAMTGLLIVGLLYLNIAGIIPPASLDLFRTDTAFNIFSLVLTALGILCFMILRKKSD